MNTEKETQWIIVHEPDSKEFEHMTFSQYNYKSNSYKKHIITALKTIYFIIHPTKVCNISKP